MSQLVRFASAFIASVAITVAAGAAPQPSPIQLRDLPGTDREWQEGSVVVAAPPSAVLRWLTDYGDWHRVYPDIEWAQQLRGDNTGRDVVRFRSKYAGRTIVLHQAISPRLLVYEGWGPNVHTQGRVYIEDLGGRTRVVMQTSAEVHGLAGVFATKGLKRNRAFQAIHGHLAALLDAAAAR